MCAVAKHPAYFWEDTLTHSAEHNINEPNPADEGEATKPAETILRQGIAIGEEQLERKSLGLMLSAVSAGLDVGFGPLMVASVLAASPSDTWGRDSSRRRARHWLHHRAIRTLHRTHHARGVTTFVWTHDGSTSRTALVACLPRQYCRRCCLCGGGRTARCRSWAVQARGCGTHEPSSYRFQCGGDFRERGGRRLDDGPCVVASDSLTRHHGLAPDHPARSTSCFCITRSPEAWKCSWVCLLPVCRSRSSCASLAWPP